MPVKKSEMPCNKPRSSNSLKATDSVCLFDPSI